MVCRNLRWAHLMKILADHETLSIVRRVGFHVDFSSIKSPLDL
jgi:hypothetical protein